jgi:hypothetical protein
MLKLALPLLAGCTAITNFSAYHVETGGDLSVSADLSVGPGADLSVADARGDLTTLTCAGGVECCAQVPCPAGGCCISGGCVPSGQDTSPNNVCVDGLELVCGTPGAPCCGQNVCHNMGCCAGGRCFAATSMCPGGLGVCTNGACVGVSTCGGNGDGCCPGGGNNGDFCTDSGTVCVNMKCETCTAIGGQFCCTGNWCPSGGCCDGNSQQCIASGSGCAVGTCMAGGCDDGRCGQEGKPCCGSGVGCTAPLTRCSLANLCDPCGGFDQRCCAGKVCSEGYSCDPLDKCRRCGGSNQLCCPGRLCNSGLSCNNASLCT